MDVNRRKFIKIGGACALGLVGLAAPFARVATANNPRMAPVPEGMVPVPEALNAGSWAMVITMSRCRPGCTDCMTACHFHHNVPNKPYPGEEIKWLWSVPFANAFTDLEHAHVNAATRNRDFLVLCNHCENPPCVRVCPTRATFKRQDGIVMMDYHRCVGCRFCMAGCPYGARSFNFRNPIPYIEEINPRFPARSKGVVEKCSFCEERLAQGLLPACVDACPEGALVFGDINDPRSEVRRQLADNFNIKRNVKLGTQPKVYYIV